MSKIAQIRRAGTAKVLLRYYEIGHARELPAETMRATGLAKTQYYQARLDLLTFGLIDRAGKLLWPAQRVVVAEEPEELTPRQRAMLVDNLPWSGDTQELMKANSPAQKRKRQQTALLQEIIHSLTGFTVSTDETKRIISATGESVEAALDLVEEMQRQITERGRKVEYPGSYLLSMAKNRVKEARPVTSKSRALPNTPATASDFIEPEHHDTKSERRRARLYAKPDVVDTGWDE